jgi:hypothetical protein
MAKKKKPKKPRDPFAFPFGANAPRRGKKKPRGGGS